MMTTRTKLVRDRIGRILNARVLFRDGVSGTSVSIADGILFQDGREMDAADVAYWCARYFENRAGGAGCGEWHIEAVEQAQQTEPCEASANGFRRSTV